MAGKKRNPNKGKQRHNNEETRLAEMAEINAKTQQEDEFGPNLEIDMADTVVQSLAEDADEAKVKVETVVETKVVETTTVEITVPSEEVTIEAAPAAEPVTAEAPSEAPEPKTPTVTEIEINFDPAAGEPLKEEPKKPGFLRRAAKKAATLAKNVFEFSGTKETPAPETEDAKDSASTETPAQAEATIEAESVVEAAPAAQEETPAATPEPTPAQPEATPPATEEQPEVKVDATSEEAPTEAPAQAEATIEAKPVVEAAPAAQEETPAATPEPAPAQPEAEPDTEQQRKDDKVQAESDADQDTMDAAAMDDLEKLKKPKATAAERKPRKAKTSPAPERLANGLMPIPAIKTPDFLTRVL